MRCQCCNKSLSDYESSLKEINTRRYLDLCLDCLHEIKSINYVGNPILKESEVGTDVALYSDNKGYI